MPVFDVRTMESLYQMRAVSTPAMITQTVTALGLMGLVLAVVGLYGVVSYTVSKRSREFGIRMAVGADRRSVVRMVLQQGLILGTAGLAVGLVLGIVVARALANSAMFSFPTNVLPFVAVSILLLLSVTFSAYVPARRASLIDPMRALREE
jgi:putative ABC transport system permease protein